MCASVLSYCFAKRFVPYMSYPLLPIDLLLQVTYQLGRGQAMRCAELRQTKRQLQGQRM